MKEGEVLSRAAMESWLDAIPVSLFLVDADTRILAANLAARHAFPSIPVDNKRKLCGEYFQCVHARETPDGCGSTEACSACVVRQTVATALAGRAVDRQSAAMRVRREGLPVRVHLLVSGAPLNLDSGPAVLLTLEDVTRLVDLHSILPICSRCRRVRNDKAAWEKLEAYLSNHLDIRFSHSICPECCEKLYGAPSP